MSSFTIPAIIDELYVLVRWPEVEGLKDRDWFIAESLLYHPNGNQENGCPAYFVPLSRIIERNHPE